VITWLYRIGDRLRHSARRKTLPVEAVNGRRGEDLAHRLLRRHGFTVVARNYRPPSGGGEIDLIAYEGETLCFVEVKTRASDWFAPPQVNVDRRKRRQIARASRAYRQMMGLVQEPYRYDVVTVVLSEEDQARRSATQIELLRNFWKEESLKKRSWSNLFYD